MKNNDTITLPAPVENLLPATTPINTATETAYVPVDGGFTGAIALVMPNDDVYCQPAAFKDLGNYKYLDIDVCREALRAMLARATNAGHRVVAVYEQMPITPLFGAKNNYINGQNNEFWRVLITLEKVPHLAVNPQKWQKHVFKGVRGSNTKAKAEFVRKQRFPRFQPNGFSKSELEGINDALCIALWARESAK